MIFVPRYANGDGCKSERGTNRKVDATRNEDGSEGNGEKPEFHADAEHFNQIGPNQEPGSNERKQKHFGDQGEQQPALSIRECEEAARAGLENRRQSPDASHDCVLPD